MKGFHQDRANSSDFHIGILSLNFQLLPRAAREGGAHIVRAAGPALTSAVI
jgi:hypothetical protein